MLKPDQLDGRTKTKNATKIKQAMYRRKASGKARLKRNDSGVREPSAWLRFIHENRARVAAEHQGASTQHVMQLLGSAYRAQQYGATPALPPPPPPVGLSASSAALQSAPATPAARGPAEQPIALAPELGHSEPATSKKQLEGKKRPVDAAAASSTGAEAKKKPRATKGASSAAGPAEGSAAGLAEGSALTDLPAAPPTGERSLPAPLPSPAASHRVIRALTQRSPPA
jgi:hypothetical protein